MAVKRAVTAVIERGVERLGLAAVRALDHDVIGQFGHPRGRVGSVAGWQMAHRPSNRQRNHWVVALLDIRPADRVLEIGFGPGLAIAELARRAGGQGHVDGTDHSGVMLPPGGQAQRRRHRRRTGHPAHRPGRSAPAREIENLLTGAGYALARTETLALDPPVVCVLAVNPDPGRDCGSPASDPAP